jgi:hypothetical protein
LSGGWIPAARYPRPPHDTEVPWLVHERMLLTNLCNRLVVTSTRWTALLPSLGLSPFRPPQPVSPFRPSLRPSFQNATVHDDAARPLPAFATLGGDAVDAAPPAAATLTAPKGRSVSRARCALRHCTPLTRPVGWLAGTPCRSQTPSPAFPRSVPVSQDLRCGPPVKAAPVLKTRSAFHRQVPSALPRACARNTTIRTATGPTTWPP